VIAELLVAFWLNLQHWQHLTSLIVDTACTVFGRVCVTVQCPSVCLLQLLTAAAVLGGFAAVCRRYRLIAAWRAPSSNGRKEG